MHCVKHFKLPRCRKCSANKLPLPILSYPLSLYKWWLSQLYQSILSINQLCFSYEIVQSTIAMKCYPINLWMIHEAKCGRQIDTQKKSHPVERHRHSRIQPSLGQKDIPAPDIPLEIFSSHGLEASSLSDACSLASRMPSRKVTVGVQFPQRWSCLST